MSLALWPVLLLLVAIPFLHRRWWNANRPAALRFPVAWSKAAVKRDPLPFRLVIRYLALAFLLIAFARPQQAYQQSERSVDGVDIVLVMDVSASMNIEDLDERARFDVAKETMRGFIHGRKNDRIGFVVFSGEPYTMVPPTLDYGLILRSITDAKSGVLKDGTGIGDGLALAVSRLKESKAKSKVIVLLTDGDNNVGQVDPETAGELAAGFGIKVYTIAIGREGRVKLPIRQKGLFGQTVTTYQWFDNALNPELLQKISALTSGKFYRVTDASALESVFREIDQLEKSEVKSNERILYEERFAFPLLMGLLLLTLEQALAFALWRFAI